jgi:signal transduction histidine kinase
MLSRRHTLLTRLLRAYKILLGSLLLLIWIGSLIYFFQWERSEMRQSSLAMANVVATQSSAALMFGDAQVLRENLAAIDDLEGLRWAVIVPTAVDLPLPPTRYRDAPDDPWRLLERMGAAQVDTGFREMLVRAPITHLGVVRGQVLILVDLSQEIEGFIRIAIATLMLLGAGFYLGLSVFTRIVRSIVAPLDDLIMVTTGVANQAMAESALENLPRPAADFGDEVGKLADAFNLMLDSILRRDAQMRTQALRLEQLVEDLRSLSARMRAVREEERTRISHEIHDELGQRLTSLKYEVARLAPGDAGRVVAGQIDELIRVVRVISWELRPSVLDSLGLVAAIEWQAQDFARHRNVRCSVDLPEGEPAVSAEMATDLFRIFQELLTNVSRHAAARRVDVILEVTDTDVHLEVKDDGRGIESRDQARPSLGLLGIRERLERWGGIIDIGPANPDAETSGTRVAIVIPLVQARLVENQEPTQ